MVVRVVSAAYRSKRKSVQLSACQRHGLVGAGLDADEAFFADQAVEVGDFAGHREVGLASMTLCFTRRLSVSSCGKVGPAKRTPSAPAISSVSTDVVRIDARGRVEIVTPLLLLISPPCGDSTMTS